MLCIKTETVFTILIEYFTIIFIFPFHNIFFRFIRSKTCELYYYNTNNNKGKILYVLFLYTKPYFESEISLTIYYHCIS